MFYDIREFESHRFRHSGASDPVIGNAARLMPISFGLMLRSN
jgi:hypothetical protein